MAWTTITERIMGVYYADYDYTPRVGDVLEIRRHPENTYDRNAIGLYLQNGDRLGWVPRELASSFAPFVDEGLILNARIYYVDGTIIVATYSGPVIDAYREKNYCPPSPKTDDVVSGDIPF